MSGILKAVSVVVFGGLLLVLISCDFLTSLAPESESALCTKPARQKSEGSADIPISGLYILTTDEILHVDKVGQNLELANRVPHSSAIAGRIIAEASSSLIYANTERAIRVFDKNLVYVGEYQFEAPVLDLAVRNQYAFALSEDALWVIDFRNPKNPQFVKRVPFPADKPGHHIILRDHFAYVLDNVIMPVFIHLIDVLAPTNPTLETLQWEGINPYLVDQVVTEDRWYILERSTTIFGIYQAVSITSPTAPLTELGVISLPSWSRNPEIERSDIDFYIAQQILVLGDTLIAAGTEVADEGYAEGYLVVGALSRESSDSHGRVSHICLDDETSGFQARASEMLQYDSTIYLAGSSGLYFIDARNPHQLSFIELFETEARVLSLSWME